MKYVCELCGYVYDETIGDPHHRVVPGTPFAALPEDYECPGCGCGLEAFDPARPKRTDDILRVQTRGKR